MKLRTREGSIRLRLGRTEVETLAEIGVLTETVRIAPGAALVFSLVTSDSPAVRALLDGSKLTVEIPKHEARTWARSETVGLEGKQESLAILIEKDFACLEPRGAEDADAFPHPGPSSGPC